MDYLNLDEVQMCVYNFYQYNKLYNLEKEEEVQILLVVITNGNTFCTEKMVTVNL